MSSERPSSALVTWFSAPTRTRAQVREVAAVDTILVRPTNDVA
jgi:hypothetical protein